MIVVVSPEYMGSTTSSVPITTPTSETSHSSGSATAYGSGGSVTAYGNSTTTTYGSKTTYIPVTVHRYEYGAIYFVKIRSTLGAFFDDLTNAERRELQTNRGVRLMVVVDGSPAYLNDLLPGDIVLSVNGDAVNGSAHFEALLERYRGQEVELLLVRGGARFVKLIALNS